MGNQFGEIRQHTLTGTKSLNECTISIQNMRKSLQTVGHPQPQLLYVDDVSGERAYFEKEIPSLKKNVEPILLEEFAHLDEYRIPENDNVIPVNSTSDANMLLNSNVMDQLENIELGQKNDIGLDCEWSYDPSMAVYGKVATCQIATSEIVFVLQIGRMRVIPQVLQIILCDDRIRKVGRNVGGDLKKLKRDYPFDGILTGWVKLGKLCSQLQFIENDTFALSKITAKVLQKKLPKPASVRLSDAWDNEILSEEQLQYAATDAFVSLDLYRKVIGSDSANMYQSVINMGDIVDVAARENPNMIVAWGTLVLLPHGMKAIDGVNCTKTRRAIEIEHAYIPAALIPGHKGRSKQLNSHQQPNTVE